MPAPNRLLDELGTPAFKAVLDEMDELLERDETTYLQPGKRWEYPWALSRAQLQAGDRVLDAGSGDSIFPIYLAKRAFAVTAVDLQFTPGLAEVPWGRRGLRESRPPSCLKPTSRTTGSSASP